MLPPADSLSVPAGTNADLLLVGGWCLLRGWSLRSTGAVPGSVQFMDGQQFATANGQAFAAWLAGTSHTVGPTTSGIVFEGGLLLHVDAGPVEGAVFVTSLERADLDEYGRELIVPVPL